LILKIFINRWVVIVVEPLLAENQADVKAMAAAAQAVVTG
jgi:hypothetical protein